ncbi:MAG: CZB domain-containing protein [Sedimentisphaerales bacterium]|nr:CZB domain-containing protein [Sedimentisphaerales bacterium]
MTIGKKLISGFLCLALLVGAAGMTGIILVKKVYQAGNLILEEKVPLKDVSMEAVISAGNALEACRELLLTRHGLETVEGRIEEYIEDLDMWVLMAKYGTESAEFQNSPAGRMYIKDGLDIIAKPGSRQMQEVIREIEEKQVAFAQSARDLIKIHRDKMSYGFIIDDKDYDLDVFLYMADVSHRNWIDTLSDSVEYEIEFEGILDPTQCITGRWLESFHTEDEELAAEMEELKEVHAKFHHVGTEVTQAPDEDKESYLSRGKRHETKCLSQIAKIQKYVTERIDVLKVQEEEHIDTMLMAHEQILIKLEHLEEIADEEMTQAHTKASQTQVSASSILIVTMAVSVFTATLLGFILSRSISRVIKKIAGATQAIARGDLTQNLKIKSKDETGDLARDLNSMTENLRKIVNQINNNASTIAGVATELAATSTQIATGTEDMTHQSTTVAGAAEEISTNMTNMSSSTEEMSANVKSVASSVEEMTASITEIAKNAEHAATVAGKASQLVQGSNDKISLLGRAADEIGKVVEVIQDIAEQTNLLALNATIEAARAGDAGKGFAVVATEVKELAKQTAEATEDISRRITAIQNTTGESIEAISQISEVIKNVNEVSRTIASAVEEQSITTKEIAQNITQTATASEMVAQGISQNTSSTREITHNITGVNDIARQNAEGAAQTKTFSNQLSIMARDLKSLIGKFNIGQINFQAAPIKEAHSLWKQKLADLLAGKISLDSSEITDQHKCEFGQWYFSEGSEKYGHLDVFQDIETSHQRVHETARKVAQLANDGKKQEAREHYQHFHNLTAKLFEQLDLLEQQVNQTETVAV